MSELTADRILAGRFRLLRRLGQGGAGQVWLAEDAELDQQVALKVLDPELAGDERHLERLREECRRAQSLVHPNIVRCHDLHSDDGLNFISMQYLAGGDLTALRGAAFQEIVRAALMLCDALDYAHRQGVVHRDLKPANVLLDARGECLLSDFGQADSLYDAGKPRGGTLPYMSPQQLDGQPPAVADDIYGLGALLYELLAGVPPLHPDVTIERIRDEQPAPLAEDGQGQALPPALQRLVSAMLDKSATSRPAGVGAVRAVLEEIRQDHPQVPGAGADLIQPVRRQAAPRGPAAGVGTLPPVQSAVAKRGGLPAGVVAGGLAVLVALALGVVFLLPSMVEEQGPLVDRSRPEPPREFAPEVDDSASSPEQRKLADAALAKLLPLEDKLKAVGIDVWGGADWTAVLNRVEIGDEAYRDRNFTAAATAYDGARAMGEALLPRAPEILADALAQGESALLEGDKSRAVSQFELALAVEADNAQAQLGLARAERLDEVLAKMAEATRLESAGAVGDAAEAYAEALEIDEQWTPASEGLARTRAAVQQSSYEQQMARGYAALSDQDFPVARRAFDAALRVKPGDADARSALKQLDAEERLQSVLVLEREARELESAERWVEAAQKYEAALAVDDGLVSARQGLERSRARARLADDVEQAIGMRDRFYEAQIGRQARAVLARARAADDAGPKLRARADELQRLLELAERAVAVRFQSDNLTQVTIYKVGRLGAFESRVIDLRPGRYVAVGSRDGYRDVRRDFRVLADGSTGPIEVRCEEPI
jgi:hypothetical protein